jgi:hypothetical protein
MPRLHALRIDLRMNIKCHMSTRSRATTCNGRIHIEQFVCNGSSPIRSTASPRMMCIRLEFENIDPKGVNHSEVFFNYFNGRAESNLVASLDKKQPHNYHGVRQESPGCIDRFMNLLYQQTNEYLNYASSIFTNKMTIFPYRRMEM